MVIFTDPKRDNQVMALYSHDTTSRVWAGLGYERHQLRDNNDVLRLARDCYVVLAPDGEIADVIARTNHIQPVG